MVYELLLYNQNGDTSFTISFYQWLSLIQGSIFTTQIFPPSQRIKVSIIQFLIPKQRKKTFFLLLLKTISKCICVLWEQLYCGCMYTKTAAINPSYLNKLCEWQNFHKTDPSINAIKFRLDFLFFVDVHFWVYSALHRSSSFGKTRQPTAEATGDEILLWVLAVVVEP